MSLHNQESQHVTNKASNSLFLNQSATGAPSMAKQIAKSAASSISNKYSTLNINNQFKGKAIEPQHKTTVLRPAPTGMQTLGKAVAARRMPPPAHLPSLRTFNSSPTQSIESTSNENSSGSQASNAQPGAPTIAAVVSGSPWAHDSNPNSSFESSTRASHRNNSINQDDFPKLDETIQQKGGERVQEASVGDEPVLRPTNLGNWSARTPVQSVDEPDAAESPRPASPASHSYQPTHHRPNNQFRASKYQPNQSYRKYQPEARIDEAKRPFLYNKNDSLVENNKENVSDDSNKIDFSNLDENNWAMISDRVDYNEKLEFEDEEESEKKSDSVKQDFQDLDELKWEDRRKEKQEELDKNLERAKLRRDEEIRRVNQEMKSVSVNDDETSAKDFNQRAQSFKINQTNNQSNRSNQNNRSNNYSRRNDDQVEPSNRPISRYHGSTYQNHQSHAFSESAPTSDKSEKTSHQQAPSNQRQSHSSQSFNQHSMPSQSNRYHQSNANQPNKPTSSNSRYHAKKSDPNQTSELRAQSEQKKSLKQLSHNVPEIESKLQPLGSKKQLPTQTNPSAGKAQAEKKVDTEPKPATESQEPRHNVWNRNQSESNPDPQVKPAQSKPEPKTKYPQRSNQANRSARRRYEGDYDQDYDDDYDEYTEEDDEQLAQNNPNRPVTSSVYSRRPNSTAQHPSSYKRGPNRRSNDYYESDSKNYYSQANRYYNYDYSYPKANAGSNYRANSRNSNFAPSNSKVFYNSNTKNASAKDQKESQNRSRDQTSVAKQSEPTDAEMYDEWETASDTSLRHHHAKKPDEPRPSLHKEPPKSTKNQPQKQQNNKKSNHQKEAKSRRNTSNTNPNDPRYTAKYWSDNSKSDKTSDQKQQQQQHQQQSESRPKTNGQSNKNAANQGRVNVQVFRVDKIVVDDPEAVKEALKTNQSVKEKAAAKANPLSGIDLNNRAGVVIVDYVPESGEPPVEENSAEDDEKDDDDGFQKVKTKRDKKAEKLKAQAAAAAAAQSAQVKVTSVKKREPKNGRKSAPRADSKAKANKIGIMNNIQTWKNDMAKPGAKQSSQFAGKCASAPVAAAEPRTKSLPDNLRKKTNAWQTNNVTKSETVSAKVVEKSIVVENKPSELEQTKPEKETIKPKEESKEMLLGKPDPQPSQKNVCTVKPTKQVIVADQKPNGMSVSVGNSTNSNSGSGTGSVVSPHSNTQHLTESQSMNKYYDKIVINQASSSAAVAASAAAAAAAVVAVTVTSIQQHQHQHQHQHQQQHQQQQIPSGEQTEQTDIKQSSSSSSIKNQSSSNLSTQSESQSQANGNEMSQMGPSQMTTYNFGPASTTSQTSLMSSPSQTNSQLSTSSLIHSLSINQSMQPAQFLQPIYQPMVQPFMPQSRPMVGQPAQSAQSAQSSQHANKPSLNSLFDLNFGEFSGKEGMFYAPPPPPHPQNYIGQMAPPPPPPQQVPLNPYPNGFEHNHQFFGQKLLNNKPNGAFVQPSQFGAVNANIKSQFAQNAPNQLINQMHQYNKQEYAFFNGQMAPGQSFAPAPGQANNQASVAAPNTNNLGFFMSQIGNLNGTQFQAQAQQSVFNMSQGQLSNNQLFGLGYNQQQQQHQQHQQHQHSSQFNLSNLMQTPQNQPSQQTPAHRQTPLSIPSSPFVQNDTQQDNAFMKQPNGFDISYKSQQANQANYGSSSSSRNGANLAANKQMFAALEATNFDKGPQANKPLTQSNSYYRSMDQSAQSHYGQVGLIPPQQQPPLLPNPPMMHNQLPSQMQQQQQQQQQQNMNNKMGFNKPASMVRYPNAYPNQSRQQAPAAYYSQNYNRRSYISQTSYQNNGKKMPFMDAKVVQKNCEQVKQDGTQVSQAVQSQTRGSTPNANEEKNDCTSANVI